MDDCPHCGKRLPSPSHDAVFFIQTRHGTFRRKDESPETMAAIEEDCLILDRLRERKTITYYDTLRRISTEDGEGARDG